MKIPEELKLSIAEFENANTKLLEQAKNMYLGKHVRIVSGKYTGRVGIVNGVSTSFNELTLLVYVLRLRPDDGSILNTDGESRSYRPLNEIEEIIECGKHDCY